MGRAVLIAVGAVGMVLVGLVALAYLAGAIYLVEQHASLKELSLQTFVGHWYWYHDDPRYGGPLERALAQAGLVLVVALLGLSMAARNQRSLYGDARFARAGEIARAGLFSHRGIIVGRYGRRYLLFDGQQFVIVAAPTRSGKGVGIVVPNLLNFSDSVVVLDIKHENFKLTAGFRAEHGQEVYLFNPFARDGRTHRYNPLTYISDDPHLRVRDILAIGTILFPPEGKDGSGKDAFWYEAARNLFLGLALLVCESPELPRTMGEVMRQASGYGRKLSIHLNAVIQGRWAEGRPLSATCVDALYRVLDNAEITYASIVSTFNAALTNWANPIFDAATSESDFLLTDVRRRRMSIYIGVTPDDLPEAAMILNMFFSQLLNLNMRELPAGNPELRHQCLLVMDEFTSMGKVTIIAKAVGFMAGYNLRLMPIIQSVAQLTAVYGEQDARTILSNHALQVIFTPKEQRDANDYSEMLGYVSEKKRSLSRPVGFGFQKGGSPSDTVADEKRALMLPQELKELGQDKEIVLLENCKPVLATKIRYYADAVFRRRLRQPPQIASLDLAKHAALIEVGRRLMSQYQLPDKQSGDSQEASGDAPVNSTTAERSIETPSAGGGLSL
ncbi:Protein VirD4 [Ralstonia psammae]|uniref:Protein VirD4 n=1 Tax=Ralstonia psammae TaxID=3058598 RepID=A0ABN9JDR3_9RALS|nr:type IV secretory system conjugative DNA transfer family protein [Ralstonia sp. LMG 19083]CAJ0808349.1 Protein VirD4 [Ralstonia sp. LMG 19083]